MLKPEEVKLMQKYLDGKASEDEILQVEILFSEFRDRPDLMQSLRREWDTLKVDDEVDLQPLLDRIHHILHNRETEKKGRTVSRLIMVYYRVAAILILPLIIASLYFYLTPRQVMVIPENQKVSSVIYAPLGSRVSFQLPDGTSGFLNSGSTLAYTIPFTNSRSVILHGEAWFDVASAEGNPFVVSDGTSEIRVLGTSFNLSAYPDEHYVEVVLAEGSLAFRPNASGGEVPVKPLDRLVYSAGNIRIEKVEPYKYSGWTEGKLIFRGDGMEEVARRLERWYNVEVEIADAELKSYVFRGTFEDDHLEEVLKLLSMTSPITYGIRPRDALPDGTWTKEKVTVFLKK